MPTVSNPRKVFKYNFNLTPGNADFITHEGFLPLTFREQHNQPTLWAEVDPTQPQKTQKAVLVMTGQAAPARGRYIGTCLIDNGEFVLHLYFL